jgi:hypothetical protein
MLYATTPISVERGSVQQGLANVSFHQAVGGGFGLLLPAKALLVIDRRFVAEHFNYILHALHVRFFFRR